MLTAGVPAETFPGERRVALTPESVSRLAERVRVVVSGGRVRVHHGPHVVAEHLEHTGRHARVTDRAHLVGVNGGPRPAAVEAARPKPELLRPLDEYAAVAGGSF